MDNLIKKVDNKTMLDVELSDWRPILAQECQVYVFGENYIAKRFDAINFQFCSRITAKEILIDNLYALLRFKYFKIANEETDKKINNIIANFTANLKTTLKKVSFDEFSDANLVKLIPDYCVAFRNGVYNFKDDEWLFKYKVYKIETLSNAIYMYDTSYIIQWYLDYDFESLDINIMKTSIGEFYKMMKELTKLEKNYCFELMHNMSFNEKDKFSMVRFEHLCQVMGYTILQSLSQHFIFLIGRGQNGKNALFDGCFTNRAIPKPASNSLDSIEEDKFITGALENKYHNIFLEASAKTYTESKNIKNLTGSMYHTIENKGENKYSGVINCKFLFSGNEQEEIKFKDTSKGFRRRINMFEIFYSWDERKRFLKMGEYYDTTFGDDFEELKSNIIHNTTFIYFAMYGIMLGTKDFTKKFTFLRNDWNDSYSDIDTDVRDKITRVTLTDLRKYLKSKTGYDDGKTALFDENKKPLRESKTIIKLGYKNYDDLIKMICDEEKSLSYFAEHDIYINLRFLQAMVRDYSKATSFTQAIRKIYNLGKLDNLYANQPYIRVSFIGDKMKVVTK